MRVEEAQQFHRERHDQSAVLLGGDLNDGLQQSQLQAAGSAAMTEAAWASFLEA